MLGDTRTDTFQVDGMHMDDSDHVPHSNRFCTPRAAVKTIVSFFVALACVLSNSLVIAYIHERVPRDTPPLPDLWFSIFPEIPWMQTVAETLMFLLTLGAVLVILWSYHRWRLLRRYFMCMSVCYLFRALCILVIQMPPPSEHTYCAPPSDSFNFTLFMDRFMGLAVSFGTELYRKRELCGDLIVSGHTLQINIAAFFLARYIAKYNKIVWYPVCLTAVTSMCCILMARKHYTIDVICGCYLAITVCSYLSTPITTSKHQPQSHNKSSISMESTPMLRRFTEWMDEDDDFLNRKRNTFENQAFDDVLGVA